VGRKYLMQNNKLNIALIGYGKMGKIIEKVAESRGHSIKLIVSSKNSADLNASKLKDIDVAIEFTVPAIAAQNLITLAQHKIPTACGTTAWLEDYEKVAQTCETHKTGFIYASNFSIGVNVLFALNKQLASIMNQFSAYDIAMTEAHHITKLDAPSGTAVTIADQIINEIDRKTHWTMDEEDSESIKIETIRAEDIKGDHEVRYVSDIDEITIKHHAFSRKGFALGAVLAAEFIAYKQGVHTMEDVLRI